MPCCRPTWVGCSCPPVDHALPVRRGECGTEGLPREEPRALWAEPRSSNHSPFFRKKKFPLTSLEAGLGPGPINALSSQALTQCLQSDSLAREPAGMCRAAASSAGNKGCGHHTAPCSSSLHRWHLHPVSAEKQLCALYSPH